MSSGLNVLSLTSGSQLAQRRVDGELNLHQLRQLEYAKHIGKYFIITRTTGRPKLEINQLAPNITVYPTNSSCRLSFSSDAGRIASQICEEHRIDLISARDPFTFGRAGLKIKNRHGIPLNIHVMADMINNPYFLGERLSNRLMNRLSKKVLSNADAIRVSTSGEKQKLLSLGYPEERIFHVPFFVDFERFLKPFDNSRRERLLRDGHEHIVLTVGRLEKQKNIPALVRAASRVIRQNSKVLFMIVGSGTREKYIRRTIEKHGLQKNIKLEGHVDYSVLPEYLHAADIFTMTSNYEGTCMALLEAASSELPIVSTEFTGAIDAIVNGETGYTVPIGDDNKLAQMIIDLLKDPARAQEMGRRGREYMLKNFDKDRIIRDCISMWEFTASAGRS